jgi:putative copper export protein
MLKLSLFLHIISAIFWVGGMLFLSLVIVPFLLALKDPKERSAVYRQIGPKYRTLAWISIIILLITGPVNLYLLGINPAVIFTPDFLATGYGKALLIKLILVFVLVVSSLLHDFWVGPKARTSRKFSSYARVFGRTNLILAVLIVLFAVFIRTAG